MNTISTTQLLDIKKAADLISISIPTLYRHLSKRKTNGLDKAAKKKGGQWRFEPEALLAWDSKSE